MFYGTKIQSLNKGKIVDENGTLLHKIADMKLAVGDTAWTDGNVIFGECFEGTRLTGFLRSGVPVLGDEGLRGYIKRGGDYKKYPIAEGDYILNTKKKYYHGDGNILDAEVVLDDNGNEIGLYTAEVSAQTSGHHYSYVYYHYAQKPNEYFPAYLEDYYRLLSSDTTEPEIHDCEITIKKDDIVVNRLKMSDLVADFVNLICGLVDIKIRHPQLFDNQYITASLYNFKIDNKGNWTALVSIYGNVVRYFVVTNTEAEYNSEIVEGKDDWIKIPYDDTNYENYISNLAALLRSEGYDENHYMHMVPDGQTLEDFLRTTNLAVAIWRFFDQAGAPCLMHIQYYHSVLRDFKQRDKETNKLAHTNALCRYLIKFSSDKAPEKIYEWCRVDPLEMTESVWIYSRDSLPPIQESGGTPTIRLIESLQHTVGISSDIDVSNFFGIGAVSSDHYYTPLETFFLYHYEYAYTAENGYADSDYASVNSVASYFDFPVQDNCYVRLSPVGQASPAYLPQYNIQGIFDSQKEICDDIPQPKEDQMKLNLSAVKLNETDTYLVGVHGDKLYKVKNNNIDEIGDGLKNFRLRKMKNVAKARK